MLGKTKLQSLITKSENIFSIFEKTKNEITIVNDEILKEIDNKETQIKVLKLEHKTLTSQIIKNNNVLININKFFE